MSCRHCKPPHQACWLSGAWVNQIESSSACRPSLLKASQLTPNTHLPTGQHTCCTRYYTQSQPAAACTKEAHLFKIDMMARRRKNRRCRANHSCNTAKLSGLILPKSRRQFYSHGVTSTYNDTCIELNTLNTTGFRIAVPETANKTLSHNNTEEVFCLCSEWVARQIHRGSVYPLAP